VIFRDAAASSVCEQVQLEQKLQLPKRGQGRVCWQWMRCGLLAILLSRAPGVLAEPQVFVTSSSFVSAHDVTARSIRDKIQWQASISCSAAPACSHNGLAHGRIANDMCAWQGMAREQAATITFSGQRI
jgi:hypothetical protein